MTIEELQTALREANVSEARVRFVRNFGIYSTTLIVHAGDKTRRARANGADIESALKAALAQFVGPV